MVDFVIAKNNGDTTLVVSLKNFPHNIPCTDDRYVDLVSALKRGATEDELLEIIQAEAKKVEAAVPIAEGFEYNAGIVTYDGVPLEPVLGDYLVTLARDGFPLTGMVNFVKNLFENPSYRAVKELYSFLRKGNNVITADGCFLAYKRIRPDYLDVYTSTVLNKPAALMSDVERHALPVKKSQVTTAIEDGFTVVSMRRNMVNEDSHETCSYGLHVCSYDYLNSYSGSRVIVCKVNPRDVVSIPVDYNHTKMRVCRYVVVSELADLARDLLGTGTLMADPTVPDDEVFQVEYCQEHDGDWFVDDTYGTYEEAETAYNRARETHGGARIVNKVSGDVLLVAYPDEPPEDDTELVIQEILLNGEINLLEEVLDIEDLEDALASNLHSAVSGRMSELKAIRAVRIREGEVVEVLRNISFGA